MQRLALLQNRRDEPLRSLPTRRAELQRSDLHLTQQRVSRRANLRQISFLTLQLIRLLRRLLAVSDHLRDAVAPATLKLGDQREPRLHLCQPCRIDHDHVCVCPQLAQRVRRMLRGGLHRHRQSRRLVVYLNDSPHGRQRVPEHVRVERRARRVRVLHQPRRVHQSRVLGAQFILLAVPQTRRGDLRRPRAAATPPDARAPASSPSNASNRRSSACIRRTIPANSSRAPPSPANRSSSARHCPGRSSERCSRCP